MREIKWESRTLSELGNLSRGKSKHRPRNDNKLYGGDFPFVQTADVKKSNFYIKEFTQTYNEIGLRQSKLWEKGTLCITIAANIAETGILSFPACFPDSIVGFVPFEKVSDVRYIKYTLDNYKAEFQKRSKGATQDNLSVSKINSLKLLVPEYDYQVAVADIISRYDQLIENNNARIEILEELAQRLYTEWFVKFKFPGHEKVKMVDSGTEYGMIPDGWESTTLGKIIDIYAGYAFKSKDYVASDGYPLVTIKNVQDCVFIPTVSTYINRNSFFLPEANINNGDILISLTGNIGRVCHVFGGEYLLNQRVGKVLPKEHYVSAFVFCLLQTKKFRNKLISIANGVAQQNLSPIQMLQIEIIIPSKEILSDFNNLCEKLINEKIRLYEVNSKLIRVRDLLIENLISGKRLLK